MYSFPKRTKSAKGEEEDGSIWGQVINLAGGDITKADHILYEESYANLVLYASAMPRYDDIEENNNQQPAIPKNGEKMNFSQFLDAMAAIKEQHHG